MLDIPTNHTNNTDNSTSFIRFYHEIANILKNTPETEDTWSLLNETIRELDDFSKQNQFPDNFPALIQELSSNIKALLTSQKSILVATTLDFVKTLGSKLNAENFQALEEEFVPSVLELIQRDSRIFQLRARECIVTLIQHHKLISRSALIVQGFSQGNEFAKCNIMEILVEYIQCFETKLEPYLGSFEDAIRVGCIDPSQDVREVTKRVYDAYRRQFKARAETLKENMDEESKNNLKAGSAQASPSQSIPSLSEGSDCDSEHVTEPTATPLISPTPSAPTTPKHRIKPLDLSSSARSSKYMSKNSPVSTASFSSRISRLTVPCDDLPFMKSTRAYHHRLSQSSLTTTYGLKSWETSGANVNNFPLTLRVYPIPDDLPDRKPFKV